jgi:hypothetical protein
VDNCLQLKKGVRFRLSGGEVELLEQDESMRIEEKVNKTSTDKTEMLMTGRRLECGRE